MACGPLSPKPEIEQTDEPRMLAPQFCDGEAELADRAGFKVLHEHVGAREHGGQQRLVLALAEIEHDRFLAAVEPDEIAALAVHEIVVTAREIALRPLDLDDARAGIGEPARAHRRGDRLFERHDEEAGQRKGFTQYDLGSPSTCSAM